jgi:hypothetical protein
MPTTPTSRCRLLPDRAIGTGGGLGLAGLLLLCWVAVSTSMSFASCGHYVRDRLNPQVGQSGAELPAWVAVRWSEKGGVWRLPIDVALSSRAETPWDPAGPLWPLAPCPGPGCRAPHLPLPQTSLATVLVPADDSSSVSPSLRPREEVPAASRPRSPRPYSDRLSSAFVHGLFKPPC